MRNEYDANNELRSGIDDEALRRARERYHAQRTCDDEMTGFAKFLCGAAAIVLLCVALGAVW